MFEYISTLEKKILELLCCGYVDKQIYETLKIPSNQYYYILYNLKENQRSNTLTHLAVSYANWCSLKSLNYITQSSKSSPKESKERKVKTKHASC